MPLEKCAISIALILFFIVQVQTFFKMTNVHCESFNESVSVFKQCRLRAIRRNITIFNMNMLLLQPAHVIHLNGLVRMKFIGGYKPFVLNYTIDCCEFVVKRNNIIANLFYVQYRDFSNINHTCPYEGEQIIKGFYLRPELFKLPMPAGDYVVEMTWYLNRVKTFVTNIFFTVVSERANL